MRGFSLRFLLAAGLLVLLALPATTRQGVNYQVTERRIPLMIKGADFLVRHYEYQHLAAALTGGLRDEEPKAVALLRWTHENIRPTPAGWPVVDDHIRHIIIRGYGEEDQMADVFATLATYAGLPAFWRGRRGGPKPGRWIASFVKMGSRWTVWDVAAGSAFRDPAGNLMSVEDLRLDHFTVPRFLRPEKQMPLRRTLFELWKVWRRLSGRPLSDDEE